MLRYDTYLGFSRQQCDTASVRGLKERKRTVACRWRVLPSTYRDNMNLTADIVHGDGHGGSTTMHERTRGHSKAKRVTCLSALTNQGSS